MYQKSIVVSIKTLRQITLKINLPPSSLVYDLKQVIWEQEGSPIDMQRLIYASRQLDDERALSEYGIVSDCTLHMVLQLRGMISNFSEYNESDPLTAYLLDENSDKISENLLKKKRAELRGSDKSCLKLEYTGSTILNEHGRKKLIGVANFIHASQQIEGISEAFLQDIKIVFPPESVNRFTGTQVEETLRAYHVCNDQSEVKFVLRRTSPTRGCIPWHVDGGYSRCVVQYTLNDDSLYKGGRLCYFTDDAGLFCPPRPAGVVTVHKQEMHAVSKLTAGVRYVLFVVDKANGLGDHTANIVTLSKEKVDQIMAR